MTAPAPAKTVAQSTPLSANASTGVATLPSGLTDGQLLLLYIAFNHSSGTVTVSSITGGSGDSWTQVDTNTSSTNLTGRCYQRTATAATDSSAAITVTYSAGTNNVAAIEIWPVGTVVDQHTTKVNASSTTEAYNAVTPSNDAADYTIIGAVALRTTSANNGRTSTPGGSYTEQAEIGNTVSGANNLSLESKYLQLTGGGNAAQTPTSGTASGACTQVAITLAIKAGSVSETLNPAVTVSTALTPSIADTLAPATTVATTLTPADRTETLAPAVQVSTALTPSIDATLAPAVAVTTTLTPAALTATLGPAVAVTTALTPAALTETLAPHTTVTTALTPSIDATLTPQVTVSTFLSSLYTETLTPHITVSTELDAAYADTLQPHIEVTTSLVGVKVETLTPRIQVTTSLVGTQIQYDTLTPHVVVATTLVGVEQTLYYTGIPDPLLEAFPLFDNSTRMTQILVRTPPQEHP